RTTEPCSIGERDRLRLLLIRSLHHQLLGRRLWCASEHCHHNNANNANDFGFHVNLLFLLLLSHHFTIRFQVSGFRQHSAPTDPETHHPNPQPVVGESSSLRPAVERRATV